MVDELRDQQAALVPVEERGAKDDDWAVIGFAGTRDGEPFEGGTVERMPIVIGQERLIPGFEEHLVGLRPGDTTEFDITFPLDYQDEALRGATAHFDVTLRELREKVLPVADDAFAASLGEFTDLANLRSEVRARLNRNALDRARHGFADRIIDYAVKNATVEIPDLLVDEEVEVMHDELRGALARQGITEEAYRKAVDKTPSSSTTNSARAPRNARRRSSSSARSPRPKGCRSPTPTWRPRRRAPGSATPTTRSSPPTSTRTGRGPRSAAPCAARRWSRS